jgi:hypothetical protein
MYRLALGAALAAAMLGSLPAAAVAARPVSLADAAVTPTAAKVLRPGASWTPHACTRPSDVSAYRSNGDALGAQRSRGDRLSWSAPRGRVVFVKSSGTFTNTAGVRVIAAVWCER